MLLQEAAVEALKEEAELLAAKIFFLSTCPPPRHPPLQICYSFLGYLHEALQDYGVLLYTPYNSLPPEERELLFPANSPGVFDLNADLQCFRTAAEHNQAFLHHVLQRREAGGGGNRSHSRDLPQHFTANMVPREHLIKPDNHSKLRSTLKQIARDWSEEGKPERDKCYGPMLEALERYLPLTKAMRLTEEDEDNGLGTPAPPFRVCCPGSGLSRLLLEVMMRGYSVQGCEFAYHMILIGDFLLNACCCANEFCVFPWITQLSGEQISEKARFRSIKFPDVCAGEAINSVPRNPLLNMSMQSGEFVELYYGAPTISQVEAAVLASSENDKTPQKSEQRRKAAAGSATDHDLPDHPKQQNDGVKNSVVSSRTVESYPAQSVPGIPRLPPGEWDAVLTCFFLDTAKNVFQYIRTLAHMIPPTKVWINNGPLLYHFADDAADFSVELSYDLLKPAIERYFEVLEERLIEGVTYTGDRGSTHSSVYTTIFFACRRNEREVAGRSTDVYEGI